MPAKSKTRKEKVTIAEVAKAAGVAPVTVSRYINTPELVSDRAKGRLKEVFEDLGYIPDGSAQALASRRSRMIGAVFPALDSSLFSGALEALQEVVAEQGYTLVVAATHYDADVEVDQVRNLIRSGVDGLVLVGDVHKEVTFRAIHAKEIPYVLTWIDKSREGHPCIGFDNKMAAKDIADHLIDLGHRRIGSVLSNVDSNDRMKQRLVSIRATFQSRGISFDPAHHLQLSNDIESGQAGLEQVLRRAPEITAVICGSEPIACGAMLKAREIGIAVPEQLSLTSFGDTWMSVGFQPGLTTIIPPRKEIGAEAGRYLLNRLAGREAGYRNSFSYKLAVRGSTAKPRRDRDAIKISPGQTP